MKQATVILCVVVLLGFSGCESMSDGTKKGAGIGALGGAALGGIIGHQSGHGWEGAAIGGAAGAVGGGLVGNRMDKRKTADNPQHITVMQVVQMTKEGVPADVIIQELRRTGSTYDMTAEILNYLKNNNVSDKVIDYMLKNDR